MQLKVDVHRWLKSLTFSHKKENIYHDIEIGSRVGVEVGGSKTFMGTLKVLESSRSVKYPLGFAAALVRKEESDRK